VCLKLMFFVSILYELVDVEMLNPKIFLKASEVRAFLCQTWKSCACRDDQRNYVFGARDDAGCDARLWYKYKRQNIINQENDVPQNNGTASNSPKSTGLCLRLF
jgi:hypothetical protein